MVPDKVVILKKHFPASLSVRQALWPFEVGKVLVVSENGDGMSGASKVLAPFRECVYDGEKFPAINVMVSFGGGEGF